MNARQAVWRGGLLLALVAVALACTPFAPAPALLVEAPATLTATALVPSPIARPSPTPAPPTPAPTTPASAEERLLGRWATPDGWLVYEFLPDHTYQTRAERQDSDPETPRGTWEVQEDGQTVLESGNWNAPIHFKTETIALVEFWHDAFFTLRRLDVEGGIIPVPAESSLRPLPLFDVAAVERVTFADSWTGLAPEAPIEATFELTRANGAFVGTALFSVAGYTDPITATATITVPAGVMDETLRRLAAVPVLEGPYHPHIVVTDSYPTLQFTARGPGSSVEFMSVSQGETHVPWKVVAAGEEYTAFSEEIAEAIERLDPFLQRDVQERLLEQVEPDE